MSLFQVAIGLVLELPKSKISRGTVTSQVLYALGDFDACLELIEHALFLNPDYRRGMALKARMTGIDEGDVSFEMYAFVVFLNCLGGFSPYHKYSRLQCRWKNGRSKFLVWYKQNVRTSIF
jgi:hypothetical protein